MAIDKEVGDNRLLLRRTELARDDGQDGGLFLLHVIVLGDAGQHDGTEQMALGTGDEHHAFDLLG